MDKVFEILKKEEERQDETLMMIASENYPFKEVLQLAGSILNNKYSEGYPGRRYYQGNAFIDEIENLAISRAKEVFGVEHVNVQPYSGSPANSAVQMALVEKGEKIMGLALSGGGHLTHGHPNITFSGKFYTSVQYNVGVDGYIDYDEVEKLALLEKPKLIICGTTAYPRHIDFERFGQIAEKVGAYLMADVSHIAGLIAGGVHPSPVEYVDVVTTTTHKTLRGPRGAMIMVTAKGLRKDEEMAKKIDKAVFPGLQGGPHNSSIAGIAAALERVKSAEFRKYAQQVVANARSLSEHLSKLGLKLVTGGTDNHLMVIDLQNMNISGKEAATLLEEAGIVANANTVPHDPGSAFKPSGIRIGTPAITCRGMRESEMEKIADYIFRIVSRRSTPEEISEDVHKLCKIFPVMN